MAKVTADQLKLKLTEKLSATHLVSLKSCFCIHIILIVILTLKEIEDVSDGCGAKFVAKIVSPRFQGLSLIEQHRLVNETIAEEMVNIHSFSMKTMTPDKWAKTQE